MMVEPHEPVPETVVGAPVGQPDAIQVLLADPTVRSAIADAIRMVTDNLRRGTTATSWTRFLALLWSAVVIVAILAVVFFLTRDGKLGDDAAAFVIGTILGASFTFIRDIFPKN